MILVRTNHPCLRVGCHNEVIMKMAFYVLLEMPDYNQNFRIFYPQFTMRNVSVKLLVMKFKLTKIDKSIGVM
jgi:hypothetical protein